MVMPPLFPCLRRLGKPWWGITAAPCMTEKTINLRGLKCPLPALRARKALAGLKSGDLLVAESNSREGDLLVFRIRKK
jgi:TusA-related sulfurtransferase